MDHYWWHQHRLQLVLDSHKDLWTASLASMIPTVYFLFGMVYTVLRDNLLQFNAVHYSSLSFDLHCPYSSWKFLMFGVLFISFFENNCYDWWTHIKRQKWFCLPQLYQLSFCFQLWYTAAWINITIKNTLYVLQYAKRYLSDWSNVEQQHVAIAIVELCLSKSSYSVWWQ